MDAVGGPTRWWDCGSGSAGSNLRTAYFAGFKGSRRSAQGTLGGGRFGLICFTKAKTFPNTNWGCLVGVEAGGRIAFLGMAEVNCDGYLETLCNRRDVGLPQ